MSGGHPVPAVVQLLPAGEFAWKGHTPDGRGDSCVVDPEAVVGRSLPPNNGQSLPVEFDPACKLPEQWAGRDAPPAGRITKLEIRETGIWGAVVWSDLARQRIVDGTCRGVDPVFTRAKDGAVLALKGATLTPQPRLSLHAFHAESAATLIPAVPGARNAGTAGGAGARSSAAAAPARTTRPAAPGAVHLVPAGTFRGRDGRGLYRLTDGRAVIERSFARSDGQPLPIDYDHQLEFAEQNGRGAPAAGWVTRMEPRDDGVWGVVEWTDAGARQVADREYRFLSPVFAHTADGEVRAVLRVGLTNKPNLNLTALHAAIGPFGAAGTPDPWAGAAEEQLAACTQAIELGGEPPRFAPLPERFLAICRQGRDRLSNNDLRTMAATHNFDSAALIAAVREGLDP